MEINGCCLLLSHERVQSLQLLLMVEPPARQSKQGPSSTFLHAKVLWFG